MKKMKSSLVLILFFSFARRDLPNVLQTFFPEQFELIDGRSISVKIWMKKKYVSFWKYWFVFEANRVFVKM